VFNATFNDIADHNCLIVTYIIGKLTLNDFEGGLQAIRIVLLSKLCLVFNILQNRHDTIERVFVISIPCCRSITTIYVKIEHLVCFCVMEINAIFNNISVELMCTWPIVRTKVSIYLCFNISNAATLTWYIINMCTYISNCVRTERFWNNLHQVRSTPIYLKAK
jgi:hypothetical protein